MLDPNKRIRPPTTTEYAEYYGKYVNLVPNGNYFEILEGQIAEIRSCFNGVSEQVAMICHAPYTWTLKQVVGHLIDVERIFADRLHRFASGDLQPLTGMDQDAYVASYDYESPTLQSLVSELIVCRQSNQLLLHRIQPQAWNNLGAASGNPVTVRALAWMLVGHITYHMQIVQKRLGNEPREVESTPPAESQW